MAAGNKLKTGDLVRIVSGRSRGREGRILRLDRTRGRVWIEGANMVKKAVRSKNPNQPQQGGLTDVEASVSWANVMIVCRKCGIARIGYDTSGADKVRVCRKCGETL
jgi:large subunit ribosomal protein L24